MSETMFVDQTGLFRSPENDKISAAFLAAQKEMTNPAKTRTVRVKAKNGREFDFDYTELPALLNEVRPILNKHQISLSFPSSMMGRRYVVSAVLLHTSGQYMGFMLPLLLPENPTAQEIGSFNTHGRRYALQGALGLASEKDDDANGISGNKILSQSAKAAGRQTENEMDELVKLQGEFHKMTAHRLFPFIGKGDFKKNLASRVQNGLLTNSRELSGYIDSLKAAYKDHKNWVSYMELKLGELPKNTSAKILDELLQKHKLVALGNLRSGAKAAEIATDLEQMINKAA